MPELYLMRHAKSAWDQPGIKDHDRTLTEQGIERTQKIIAFLKLQQIHFDLIISSSATRAKNTAMIVASETGYDPAKIQTEKSLYESEVTSYFDVLELIPKNVHSVLLVAHNPTISEFFLKLSRFPVEQYMPTSGLTGLQIACNNWTEIRKADVSLKFIIFPKMLI